jgi:hypothetical protein
LLGLFGPGVERVFYPVGARVFTLDENVNQIQEKMISEFRVAEIGSKQSSSTSNDLNSEVQISTKHRAIIHCKLSCNPCDQVNCVRPENPCIRRISLNSALQVLKNYVLTQ